MPADCPIGGKDSDVSLFLQDVKCSKNVIRFPISPRIDNVFDDYKGVVPVISSTDQARLERAVGNGINADKNSMDDSVLCLCRVFIKGLDEYRVHKGKSRGLGVYEMPREKYLSLCKLRESNDLGNVAVPIVLFDYSGRLSTISEESVLKLSRVDDGNPYYRIQRGIRDLEPDEPLSKVLGPGAALIDYEMDNATKGVGKLVIATGNGDFVRVPCKRSSYLILHDDSTKLNIHGLIPVNIPVTKHEIYTFGPNNTEFHTVFHEMLFVNPVSYRDGENFLIGKMNSDKKCTISPTPDDIKDAVDNPALSKTMDIKNAAIVSDLFKSYLKANPDKPLYDCVLILCEIFRELNLDGNKVYTKSKDGDYYLGAYEVDLARFSELERALPKRRDPKMAAVFYGDGTFEVVRQDRLEKSLEFEGCYSFKKEES